MAKRRYITFKVDDVTGTAGLHSQGPAGEPLGVRCGRCMRFCGFCCVCTCTLFQALAPWMLCVIEVVTLVLLLLLVVVPHRPPGPYSFDFHISLEDVVLLGGLRDLALAGTYACGSSSMNLRAYLYTSYVCGCGGLLYVTFKACLYSYPVAWLPPAAIMVTFATFSWLHILAARYTLTWYRRRGRLGLLQAPGQSQGSGRLRLSGVRACVSGVSAARLSAGADVPAELLADCDSHFIDVDGLVVHYKEASPAACMLGAPQASPGCSDVDPRPRLVRPDVAIMCVHGFGGGVFAWRHLMQPLADAVGVRVLAFDRPGFGLTARPQPSLEGDFVPAPGQHDSSTGTSLTQPLLPTHTSSTQAQQQQHAANPYTFEAQGRLMLRLCELLGIQEVLLVTHADGCIVAARAAAAAAGAAGGDAGGAATGMLQQRDLVHASCAPHQRQQQQAVGSPCHLHNSSSSSSGITEIAESAHVFPPTSVRRVSTHVGPRSSSKLHKCDTCESSEGGICVTAGQTRSVAADDAVGEEGTLPILQHQQQPQRLAAGGVVLTPPCQEPPWHNNRSSTCSRVTCSQAGESSSSSKQHQGCGVSSNRSSGGGGGDGGVRSCVVRVCGLALLHPVLCGQQVPAFIRLMAATSLGRSISRHLLRTQVGVVSQRRAWAHASALTGDVLALYERPLRVEGWSAALLATCREAAATRPQQLAPHFAAIKQQPVLCVTGECDRIASASKVSAVAAMLSNVSHGVVPDCGHLSHEEAPHRLMELLAPFCANTLHNTAAAAGSPASASGTASHSCCLES